MPPWALTYWKYALDAGAISLYPGAAGPVSGWWLPIRIWFAVMPGAAAALPPEAEPPQAAASRARAVAAAAMAGNRTRCALFIRCLLPGAHWPAAAGAVDSGSGAVAA